MTARTDSQVQPYASTQDMFRLDHHVAIVTGAAGLLGEQHALALADVGANVVLVDRDVDTCQKRAREIVEHGQVRASALSCDVTKKSSWEDVLQQVLSQYGRVDVLVNNAGYTTQSRSKNYDRGFLEFPLEDWHQILEVNLTGTFLGCQVIGSEMIRQRSGSIVNLASLYGVVSPNHRLYPDTGIHQPAAYSVSKAGVLALTRYLATLWADQKVRVNCITPGGVDNGHPELFATRYGSLCPSSRMARPDEMRGALVYLASSASSYCTGHNLVVDGGWTAW
jgi:NAD(P)-dependent dehydrogenase (short-subunit alcohol dehydrogenase family)